MSYHSLRFGLIVVLSITSLFKCVVKSIVINVGQRVILGNARPDISPHALILHKKLRIHFTPSAMVDPPIPLFSSSDSYQKLAANNGKIPFTPEKTFQAFLDGLAARSQEGQYTHDDISLNLKSFADRKSILTPQEKDETSRHLIPRISSVPNPIVLSLMIWSLGTLKVVKNGDVSDT